MRNIDFPESNITLGPLEGMTDEDCLTISAFKGVDVAGNPFFLTCFELNKDDREAILAGRPIWVKTIGSHFQPVAIFTTDESGVSND